MSIANSRARRAGIELLVITDTLYLFFAGVRRSLIKRRTGVRFPTRREVGWLHRRASYSADICRLPLTPAPKLILISSMKSKCLFTACFAFVSLALVITSSAADTQAAEKTLRDLDAQWSAAAGAKDVDKTVSFYSNDAVVMPPNAPADTTKEAIRKGWQDLLATPGLLISWKTTKVEVAKSGDMAVLTGTYEMTMKDGSKDNGKYCEVWQKKADGKWKVGIDMFSSDLPAQPASSPGPGAAERK